MQAIGIDLGGTNIKAALIDQHDGIRKKVSIPTEEDQGKDHVFDRIKLAIDRVMEGRDEKPIGVGMGSPGVVSLDRTTVTKPPNLTGWEVVHVSDEVYKRTGFTCIVENDANLAALGSSRFGVGRDFDSMIMITLGTGVGGGIILHRNLLRGTTGSAAELGHVIIDYHGPLSNSNTRGGIEAYLGQRFLSRYAVDLIRQQPNNPLYKAFHNRFDEMEPVDLYHAAESGNELAAEILHKSGEKLGYAIVNYIHILDIRKIIISGGVAKAGHWIIDPAKKTALSYLMPPFRTDLEILFEPLGNDAALYGASSLAMENL